MKGPFLKPTGNSHCILTGIPIERVPYVASRDCGDDPQKLKGRIAWLEADRRRLLNMCNLWAKTCDEMEAQQSQPPKTYKFPCDCHTKAPTYPTFRDAYHLPGCALRNEQERKC